MYRSKVVRKSRLSSTITIFVNIESVGYKFKCIRQMVPVLV